MIGNAITWPAVRGYPAMAPLAWVPTLDSYRLTRSHLPVLADEATRRTF